MILLTGSAGYIGSHISHILEKNKIDYLGIDNLSKSSSKNIFNKKKFIKIDYGNIGKISKLLSDNSISTVIHSAAYAYVLEGEKKKKIYFKNNVEKSKKFINECIKKKISNFIFLSSSNVYKDTNKRNPESSKIKLKNIKNNYGKTKFLIEKYLLTKKKNFRNIIILRLFNIAAYNKNLNYIEKKEEKNLRIFPLIFKKINEKKIINIYIKKNHNKYIHPKRDYLHINDLMDLIIKILKNINNLKNKGIFNVGMGNNYSLKKIQSLISNKISNNLRKRIIINYKHINSKELISTLSDIKKTKKNYDWRPKNSINDIVFSCIRNLIKKDK
jgi:UDP-glucose 4-epimerase